VKHLSQAVIGLAVIAGLAFASAFAIDYLERADASSGLPDVRGNLPRGDYHTNSRWVKPLLDAGYCVRYHYDGDKRVIDHGDGKVSMISDTYYIVDEDLDAHPSSNRPTVIVTVTGAPMDGATVDWDAMPVVCP